MLGSGRSTEEDATEEARVSRHDDGAMFVSHVW